MEHHPFGEEWLNEVSDEARISNRSTGKEWDRETGLYYFGARYYDPRTSLWQSPDPALVAHLNAARANYATPSLATAWRPILTGNGMGGAFDPNGRESWSEKLFGNLFGNRANQPNTNNPVEPAGRQSSSAQPQNTTNAPATNSFPAQKAPVAQSTSPRTNLSGAGTIDVDKIVDYLHQNVNTTEQYSGRGAAVCARALEAGGFDTTGRPVPANQYGSFLERRGANAVAHGKAGQLPRNFTPQKGDIAVFEGGAKNQSGCIQIHDGTQWISDTRQPRFAPLRDYQAGVTIYRLGR